MINQLRNLLRKRMRSPREEEESIWQSTLMPRKGKGKRVEGGDRVVHHISFIQREVGYFFRGYLR